MFAKTAPDLDKLSLLSNALYRAQFTEAADADVDIRKVIGLTKASKPKKSARNELFKEQQSATLYHLETSYSMNTRQFYEWIGRPRGILSLLTPMSHEINGAESLTSYLLRNQLALGVRINELMDHASRFIGSGRRAYSSRAFITPEVFPMSLNGNSQSTGLLTKGVKPNTGSRIMILRH